MPMRSQEDQEIVQARLLYTALIKAVLIAWGRGYSVANPHQNPFALSENKQFIIDSIVSYFNAVPAENGNGLHGRYAVETLAKVDAEQIAPALEAISALHKAVKHSGQKYARDIAGETEIETIKNLIAFFNERPE
jgi:hypothetical protein